MKNIQNLPSFQLVEPNKIWVSFKNTKNDDFVQTGEYPLKNLFFHMLPYDNVSDLIEDLGQYPLTNKDKGVILYHYYKLYNPRCMYNPCYEDMVSDILNDIEDVRRLFIHFVSHDHKMYLVEPNDKLSYDIKAWIFKVMGYFQDQTSCLPFEVDFSDIDYTKWDQWVQTTSFNNTIQVLTHLKQQNLPLETFVNALP